MTNILMQKILTEMTKKLEDIAMLKDKYSYIALFTYEDAGISIEFPDLPGCYPCADKDNTDEALKNAKKLSDFIFGAWNKIMEIIPEAFCSYRFKTKTLIRYRC